MISAFSKQVQAALLCIYTWSNTSNDASMFDTDPDEALLPRSKLADEVAEISVRTGGKHSDVIT